MPADRSLDRVLIHRLDAASAALAARWSPELRFDRHEPFFPLLAGVTLFDADGPSPSFPRQISLAPATPGARAAAQFNSLAAADAAGRTKLLPNIFPKRPLGLPNKASDL